MNAGLTVECAVHFRRRYHDGRMQLRAGPEPPSCEPGCVPRISRLMALALRLEGLLREGVIANYAEVAALGHVSRARVSQVMNLLCLCPSIQEEILFLPRTRRGRAPIHLRLLQPIASTPDRRRQRRLWRELCRQAMPTVPASVVATGRS